MAQIVVRTRRESFVHENAAQARHDPRHAVLRVALLALVQRYPAMSLGDTELTWGRSLFRVPERMPLRVR